MNRRNKKDELIEATMGVVAENGLPSFSMRKVTMRVGVSEALIYRHFYSKENVFEICFERMVSILGEELGKVDLSGADSPEGVSEVARRVWLAYLNTLVDNGYRSLFFFEYREYYHEKVWQDRERIEKEYFSQYKDTMCEIISRYGLYDRVDPTLFWSYITDVTSWIVKRRLHGQLENTPEAAERAWNLIWGGVKGRLLPESK